MDYCIIISGFGGQGILTLGKILTSSGMNEDYNVTFYPSYGAEVRGGTCHSGIIISDTDIASPIVSKADALIMFNEPSLKRFLPMIKDNGLVIYNTTLTPNPPKFSNSYDVHKIPATYIANQMGVSKAMNMVIMGFFFKFFGLISKETFLDDCDRHFVKLSQQMKDRNKTAFYKGYEYEFTGAKC